MKDTTKLSIFDKKQTEEQVGAKFIKEQFFFKSESGLEGKYVAYFVSTVDGWFSNTEILSRITVSFTVLNYIPRYEVELATLKEKGWLILAQGYGVAKQKVTEHFDYGFINPIVLEALDDLHVCTAEETLKQMQDDQEKEEKDEE